MAETPTRAGPTLLTTAATTQTIYTASTTWAIVRGIYVTNVLTAQDVKVTVGIGTTNTDSAGKRLVYNVLVAGGETQDIVAGGFIPLANADLIYALCDTANGANVTLGLITGP